MFLQVADLWEGDDQGAGVIVIVFASVAGASLGPIFGGLIQQGFSSWRAIFWFQLIFGGVVQLVHLFLVPETRSVILLHRAAKQRRKEGKMDEADQIESLEDQPKITLRYAWTLWYRPVRAINCPLEDSELINVCSSRCSSGNRSCSA